MMPWSEDFDADIKNSPKVGTASSQAHSPMRDLLQPLRSRVTDADGAALTDGLTLERLLYFVLIEDQFPISGLEQ